MSFNPWQLWIAVSRAWLGFVGFLERHGWLVALVLSVVLALTWVFRALVTP